jgi:hypothetical protein
MKQLVIPVKADYSEGVFYAIQTVIGVISSFVSLIEQLIKFVNSYFA